MGHIKLYRNKDWIKKQYIELEKSTREIAREFNYPKTTINRWLNRHKIKIRNQSEAEKLTFMKWKNHKGKNNPHWLGNNVGNSGLHIWAINHFIKPLSCELCGKPFNKIGKGHSEWSRKDHNVNTRDRNDWQYVHKKCHEKYDHQRLKSCLTLRK